MYEKASTGSHSSAAPLPPCAWTTALSPRQAVLASVAAPLKELDLLYNAPAPDITLVIPSQAVDTSPWMTGLHPQPFFDYGISGKH